MDGLYSFASTVAAMAVICTLMEFCMPGGKLKGSVRMAAGLLFVLAIAQPIVRLASEGAAAFPTAHAGKSTRQTPVDHEEWLRTLYTAVGEEIGQAAE